MTWSSGSAHSPGGWITGRPAMLPAMDGTSAWMLDELSPPSSAGHGDAQADDAPTAEELRVAAAEARELSLADERDRMVAAALAEGRASGEAAGRAAERARLATALQSAEQALAQLRAGEARWLEQLEDNVCALAVAVARQVIGRELNADPATLTNLLRRALTEFPIDQAVSIRVNPQDMAMLAAAHPTGESLAGTAAVAPNREARWIADPSVVAGGCIVEGRERIIDGRVDAALERVYRRMTGNHA
ncbi:MAG: FliH/SctL family protein [Gemmatimonadaceae bacterium]